MKTAITLALLTVSLIQSPAILTQTVRVPAPKVIVFSKKASKFIRHF